MKIISTIENHPYYLQQFARNIWLIAGRKVTIPDFDRALQALKTENLNYYTELLDALTGYQASFLRALLNNEKALYSSDVINGYKLGSSANVRRMYQSFVQKGIIVKDIDTIVFTDPIFKILAQERFSN